MRKSEPKKKLRVGVIGATGYSGLELMRLLGEHPHVRVTYATSRSFAGKRLSEVFPGFVGFEAPLETYASSQAAQKADFFFLALPHGLSGPIALELTRAGKKVVDLGSDFRLKDPQAYPAWYGKEAFLAGGVPAVYGLPELHRALIRKASLVANPGCYACAVILAFLPLVKEKAVDLRSLIADAKSGVSGAGRSLSLSSHFVEVHENFQAYKVGRHQHTPEIEQELASVAQAKAIVRLTTHLVPMKRGILAACYGKLLKKRTTADVLQSYIRFYRNDPFVKIYPEGRFPATRDVYGTNICALGVHVDSRTQTVLVLSAIDNLTRGAAGGAVQNMNLMSGFSEEAGLPKTPWVP